MKREPLVARPVKGPIDHEAHFQDILRRFPKTIAYLGRKSGEGDSELPECTIEEFRARVRRLKSQGPSDD